MFAGQDTDIHGDQPDSREEHTAWIERGAYAVLLKLDWDSTGTRKPLDDCRMVGHQGEAEMELPEHWPDRDADSEDGLPWIGPPASMHQASQHEEDYEHSRSGF